MDGSSADHSLDRSLRRLLLAQRLTARHVRTQTVCSFTALSRHQLAALRKRWGIRGELRHRGPAPHSLRTLFRSRQLRNEGACVAVLCELLGAIPSRAVARHRRGFFTIEVGERLCDVFDAYRSYAPHSQFELEQLIMLAIELAKGDEIALGSCSDCRAAILIDLFSVSSRLCSLCRGGIHREPLGRTDNSFSAPLG